MNKTSTLALLGACMAFSAIAVHAEGVEGLGVELKGGLLGAGLEVNYAINPMFTVGAGINSFTFSESVSASDIDYDVDLKLRTFVLLGNYHPFEGIFRVTAGLMSNGNKLSMKAKPSGATYDIGGTSYDASQVGTLKATVDFNSLAPYLGLGWGKSAGSGFGVTFDVGVLFQGSPNVSMNVSGAVANDPTFMADLKKEEANAEDDIKGFTMYPVTSLGIDYRF